MRVLRLLAPTLALVAASAACDSEDSSSATSAPDAATTETGAADTGAIDSGGPAVSDAGSDAATYVEPTNCTLRNDPGGPGQYSDGCVKRSWIAAYAGTYTSAKCQLTITIDGAVAATFTMKVLSGAFAGDYTTAWDGAPAPGNDSYYRFTTDATFATTKILNFTSGQKLGTADERTLSLRVENIDTGTSVFKGRYGQVIAGKNDEVDCETITKK